MARSPPTLSPVKGARDCNEQITALRALRDEIVGHAQSKKYWVQQGILESLVKMIRFNRVSPGLTNSPYRQPGSLEEEQRVRLLALQLLASFAKGEWCSHLQAPPRPLPCCPACPLLTLVSPPGGSSFLESMHAVGALPVILSNINPLENPPQIVLTALRALSNITHATLLAAPGTEATVATLAEKVFVPRSLATLCAILTSDPAQGVTAQEQTTIQEQKCLVASLIARLCRETRHQNAVANAGILDALATMLASFVVARGEVVPRAEIIGESDGLADMIPAPAPRGASLAAVLEAIAAIIADSRFRACMLLSSPAIMAVFPTDEFSPPAKELRCAWAALKTTSLGDVESRNPGAMDYLLPIIPVSQARPHASLGSARLRRKHSVENLASRESARKPPNLQPTAFDTPGSGGVAEADDLESPMVPWLMHVVRSTAGMERLMAASVLASLFKAGFAHPDREVALGVLVVPLLCQLLKDHDKDVPATAHNSELVNAETEADWAIMERAPSVLARLVADSEVLQHTAFECDAMSMACKLLKNAYKPMPALTVPKPWSPNPQESGDVGERPPGCRVGQASQLPIYAHKISMRESCLKLIAAIITFKEEYRKALVEHETVILPYIVESLSATPQKPRTGKEKAKSEKGVEEPRLATPAGQPSPYGINPTSVVIAACHVLRVLGRSVNNLRTALEDHGVMMPIFNLLRHPDAEVKIAACGVVCNLVTDFSPMRKVNLPSLRIRVPSLLPLPPPMRLLFRSPIVFPIPASLLLTDCSPSWKPASSKSFANTLTRPTPACD